MVELAGPVLRPLSAASFTSSASAMPPGASSSSGRSPTRYSSVAGDLFFGSTLSLYRPAWLNGSGATYSPSWPSSFLSFTAVNRSLSFTSASSLSSVASSSSVVSGLKFSSRMRA